MSVDINLGDTMTFTGYLTNRGAELAVDIYHVDYEIDSVCIAGTDAEIVNLTSEQTEEIEDQIQDHMNDTTCHQYNVYRPSLGRSPGIYTELD